MSYPEIIVPTEGDGSTFTLLGMGFYRGQRLAAVHFRILSYLIDAALVAVLYFPLAWLDGYYYDVIALKVSYDLWIIGDGLGVAAVVVPLAVWFLNVVFMQSRTGQSFGKLCLGLVLVRPEVDPMNVAFNYLALPKMPLLVFRALMEGFDLILGIGVLFVLFTRRRESIADKICNTMVLRPYDLDTIYLHTDLTGARDR